MKNSYTLPLADQRASLETVGGKGASLAKLINAGLPVPDGFHITTAAYRQFVEANQLEPGIQAALVSVDASQPQSLAAASQKIGEIFAAAPIPPEIAEAVNTAYAALADRQAAALPVAVRSSATAEDLPEASFAGQQETYLNIQGAAAVLAAVRKCWASLWTARAIGYRARQQIGAEGVALAVVVQVLVPAEAAGILFSANPVNGRRDQMLVSASWGLGEAVVGGLVTPDNLTLAKSSGEVIQQEIGQKMIQTVRVDGGTEEVPVPEKLRLAPVIDARQAARLCRLGNQIEEIYGTPMDIEWVLLKDQFSIVQARPITALPEIALAWKAPDAKGVYMRGSVVDLMPGPLSPLFVSLGIETLKEQMKPLSKRLTRREANMADDYFTTINSYAYMNAHIPPKALKWVLTGLLPSYPRIMRSMVPFFRDELQPEYREFVETYRARNLSDMTPAQLWDHAQNHGRIGWFGGTADQSLRQTGQTTGRPARLGPADGLG